MSWLLQIDLPPHWPHNGTVGLPGAHVLGGVGEVPGGVGEVPGGVGDGDGVGVGDTPGTPPPLRFWSVMEGLTIRMLKPRALKRATPLLFKPFT